MIRMAALAAFVVATIAFQPTMAIGPEVLPRHPSETDAGRDYPGRIPAKEAIDHQLSKLAGAPASEQTFSAAQALMRALKIQTDTSTNNWQSEDLKAQWLRGTYYFPQLQGHESTRPGSDADPVRNASIVNLLPQSGDQFYKIFGRWSSAADSDAYERAVAIVESSHADTYFDFVKVFSSPNKFVVVVGHNQDGDLVLPDGKHIDLRKLSDYCVYYSKVCVFLVCNSSEFVTDPNVGIAREISMSAAAFLARDIAQFLQAPHNYSTATIDRTSSTVFKLLSRIDGVKGVKNAYTISNEYYEVFGLLVLFITCLPNDTQCHLPGSNSTH